MLKWKQSARPGGSSPVDSARKDAMTLIKGIASIGAAVLIGLSASSAQAGYVVYLTAQGNSFVATGSGAIDVTGLTLAPNNLVLSELEPDEAFISTGASAYSDIYSSSFATGTFITGPANFGSGGLTFPASGSGDLVGIWGAIPELFVPLGYVSDSPLSDTTTYSAPNVPSLGVTPGRYEWTWGSGADQNFTLIAIETPEVSTWAMMLLGFVGLGLMRYQSASRRRWTTCTT
jgi:hypothetical protein